MIIGQKGNVAEIAMSYQTAYSKEAAPILTQPHLQLHCPI